MFFIIGFGVGISGFLIPALKSAFNLTTGQSYLVTAAIFSAFVIFGRPTGWVIKKIGYRRSMVLAFFIMALGMLMFVPSSNMQLVFHYSCWHFLWEELVIHCYRVL